MAKKPSTAVRAERDETVEQPKRDSKDAESRSVSERLDAARGGVDSARTFARETVQELKKVQWPSRRQVGVETVVVFVTVAVVTVMVTIFDKLLTLATNQIFTP